MKRCFTFLVCLLSLTVLGQGLFVSWNRFNPGPILPCSVDPYILTENFESPGYDFPCTNWVESGSGTYTNNPTYTNVVLQGSYSFQHYSSTGIGNTHANFASAYNELWFYGLLRPITLPPASQRIMTLLGGSTGGSGLLQINNLGQLSVAVDGQSAFATTADGMSVGTTYRVWVRIKIGTTAGPIAATVGFSTTGTKPLSGTKYAENLNNPNYDSGQMVGLQLGEFTSSTMEMIWDTLRVSTTNIGDNPP
jgi:hypothetical protein